MDTKKNDTIALRDMLTYWGQLLAYLKSKKWMIIGATLLGLGLGLFLKLRSVPQYTAISTFSIEEGSKPAMGGLDLLGLGSGIGGSGLFTESKNIIWLYSSKEMVSQVLLAKSPQGKRLIDIYLHEYKILEKLKGNLKSVSFEAGDSLSLASISPAQAKVLDYCYNIIVKKNLLILPEPNTENIVRVSFSSSNELLSLLFVNELVEKVNHFYIDSKTGKQKKEIEILTAKADSVRAIMNRSINQVAIAYDDVPYANPMRSVSRSAPQKKQVDVEVSAAMYSSVIQNLEASKLALQKETPLIQVIDKPRLPLNQEAVSYIFVALIALVFPLVLIVVLVIRRYIKGLIKSGKN